MSSQSTKTMTAAQQGRRETSFIETSGGLLTEQLVIKLRDESCSEDAVQPETFKLTGDSDIETATDLESEISEAWEDLKERWDTVSQNSEIFGMDTSTARTKWIIPLLESLGFDPAYQQANLVADNLKADLSHLGWSPEDQLGEQIVDGTPPITHLIQPDKDESLDSGSHIGSDRKSPHDELQQFLNAADQQWSIVTDGLKLRLLRDYYHTYTRGYIEFDLENIFTNRNYEDFRALYRLCHASRFVESSLDEDKDKVELPIEELYQVALSTGVKIGQDLQENVVNALETLGNGFLNDEIREAIEEGGQGSAEDYYQDLLYVVYRLLFLMFTEQRGMMSQRNSLYIKEYSITRLRERAEEHGEGDRNTDLWEGVKTTFHLVGKGDDSLGVPGYNGDLFDDDNLNFILKAECPNDKLLSAVHDLCYIEQDGYRQRISYADLGVEEIGAVYESLLEFTPQLAKSVVELGNRTISADSFYLDDRGMERKETGSYYTDPGLVDELIQDSLKPVVEDRINYNAPTKVQEEQLLNLSVCDPACGSGAFLIAANNFLGQKLAEIRSESSYPDDQTVRQARRSVVQYCIYGVDLNPMAVELAKVSLWINSAVEDQPLNFLDHHIKQGNSLIGTTPELIASGIPDDAYETSKGRKNHVGTNIRRLVRKQNKRVQSELTWYDNDQSEYISLSENLNQIDETRAKDVNKKERVYQKLRQSQSFQRELIAHDVWTAAFYWPLEKYQEQIEVSGLEKDKYLEEYEEEFPTPKNIERIRREIIEAENKPLNDLQGIQKLCEKARQIAKRESFFHWKLEFPEVFSESDGFDCILGNPPWDRLIFQAKEFFAVTAPEVVDSSLTKSERQGIIDEFEVENPQLYSNYINAKKRVQNQKKFIKNSNRYPLTSHGIINLYAPFAEIALTKLNKKGASGIIVPTRIATASNTQEYFRTIVEKKQLNSLYDFQNKSGIFPDVHKQFKFSLLTLYGESMPQNNFELAFHLTRVDELADENKKYNLSPEDIEAVNPNTKTCPTFHNSTDANLIVDIYRKNTILKSYEEKEDLWDINLRRMFNNTDDDDVFERKWDLEKQGWSLSNNVFVKNGLKAYPLYESKLINQYDYRFATYEGLDKNKIENKKPKKVGITKKNDISYNIYPSYWVKEEDYNAKWEFDEDWHLVLRKVTNSTNRRTVIASVIPKAATEDSVNHLIGCSAEEATLLLACLNSYVLDYVARQKVGGENLKQYTAEQLPIPTPETFDTLQVDGVPIKNRIVESVLKLMHTGEDLTPLPYELDCRKKPWSFTNPSGKSREEIRFELEALLAHAYSRTISDLDKIFNSFQQVEQEDIRNYGYYRTREEIKSRFEEINVK